MTNTYNIGQTVKTVYGETFRIIRIEDTGISFIYEGWISGRGMAYVHETKIVG